MPRKKPKSNKKRNGTRTGAIIALVLVIVALGYLAMTNSVQASATGQFTLGDYWGKLFNRQLVKVGVAIPQTCYDTDHTNKSTILNSPVARDYATSSDRSPFVKGRTETSLEIYEDTCVDSRGNQVTTGLNITNTTTSTFKLKEYYCDGNKLRSVIVACDRSKRQECFNGACV